MPRSKVTEKVLGTMRSLRAKGLTYAEIAKKTGLSRPTVAEYLRKGREAKAGSLEKLAKRMKKWEPTRRKLRNEVSIDKKGIDILSWAADHFKGYGEVDLYVDDRGRSLGVKPVAKGQRKLSPKGKAGGFLVSCTQLMERAGVNERRRVPAVWSEKKKMLIVDLR